MLKVEAAFEEGFDKPHVTRLSHFGTLFHKRKLLHLATWPTRAITLVNSGNRYGVDLRRFGQERHDRVRVSTHDDFVSVHGNASTPVCAR